MIPPVGSFCKIILGYKDVRSKWAFWTKVNVNAIHPIKTLQSADHFLGIRQSIRRHKDKKNIAAALRGSQFSETH